MPKSIGLDVSFQKAVNVQLPKYDEPDLVRSFSKRSFGPRRTTAKTVGNQPKIQTDSWKSPSVDFRSRFTKRSIWLIIGCAAINLFNRLEQSWNWRDGSQNDQPATIDRRQKPECWGHQEHPQILGPREAGHQDRWLWPVHKVIERLNWSSSRSRAESALEDSAANCCRNRRTLHKL